MILADTDVLIDALRGRDPGHRAVSEALGSGRLATTTITVFELESGSRSESEAQLVATLLAGLDIVALDPPSATYAATVRRNLRSRGEEIGTADYLIAGICLRHGAELLTRNRVHFERVSGLRLATI